MKHYGKMQHKFSFNKANWESGLNSAEALNARKIAAILKDAGIRINGDTGVASSGMGDATANAAAAGAAAAAAAAAAMGDSGTASTGTGDTGAPAANGETAAANSTTAASAASSTTSGDGGTTANATSDSAVKSAGTGDSGATGAEASNSTAATPVAAAAAATTASTEVKSATGGDTGNAANGGGDAAAAAAKAAASAAMAMNTESAAKVAPAETSLKAPGGETAKAAAPAGDTGPKDNGDNRGGAATDDTVLGKRGSDSLAGGDGKDTMVDTGGTGNGKTAPDYIFAGNGDDMVHAHWGRDNIIAGAGNDTIISRSDALEPKIAQLGGTSGYNDSAPVRDKWSTDQISGGDGADNFAFRIDINAKASILAKHTNAAGTIDWEGVTGENNAPHDHWVESIGNDIITDFSRAQGDHITISGHTVEVTSITYQDMNRDGKLDTVIKLISQQGAAGAHDEDSLGSIVVLGDNTDNTKVTAADISVNANAHHGAFESIDEAILKRDFTSRDDNDYDSDNDALRSDAASAGNDTLYSSRKADNINGGGGDDTIVDLGTYKDNKADTFMGGDGNDIIRTRWGADTAIGGEGNDLIVSRSDGGEALVAQNGNTAGYYKDQPFKDASITNDTLTGGGGADTFFFRLDLNATPEILAKHVHDFAENHDHGEHDESNIDWHGVTGENGSAHLHWLDTIGTDTITDFSRDQKDAIRIEGHTAEIKSITQEDRNKDGKMDSIINIISQQGAAGSHDEDQLGTIVVLGDGNAANLLTMADIGGVITVDANVVHGAFGNIDEINWA